MKPHIKSDHDSSPSDRKTKIQCSLAMFAAALLVLVLNGCASLAASRDPDPWQFNANTGYPAVGGPLPTWGRF